MPGAPLVDSLLAWCIYLRELVEVGEKQVSVFSIAYIVERFDNAVGKIFAVNTSVPVEVQSAFNRCRSRRSS
jgi:hypothetical protein